MTAPRIIEVSREIRLYLPSLLSAAEADALDQVIASLLRKAGQTPEETAAELTQVLSANRVTRKWMQRALRNADPARYERRLVDVTTPPQPVSAPRYRCGVCGYVWYRRSGVTPPPCPRDSSALIAEGATA